jgi:hypothetical protein
MKYDVLVGYTEAAELSRMDGGHDDARGFPVSNTVFLQGPLA